MCAESTMDVDAVVSKMMHRYDDLYPGATPFERGSVEYDFRKIITEVAEMGGTITFPAAPRSAGVIPSYSRHGG